ncbi:hypothetical protein ScalyP_jg86, partial [Parmales sp. scaly parma]
KSSNAEDGLPYAFVNTNQNFVNLDETNSNIANAFKNFISLFSKGSIEPRSIEEARKLTSVRIVAGALWKRKPIGTGAQERESDSSRARGGLGGQREGSEEDDEKVAEFLKEFDVRDEEEVLEKLLEAKVNGARDCYGYGENDAERGGGGCGRRCE